MIQRDNASYLEELEKSRKKIKQSMKFVHLFGPFGKFYYIKVSRNVIYWGKYSNNGVR